MITPWETLNLNLQNIRLSDDCTTSGENYPLGKWIDKLLERMLKIHVSIWCSGLGLPVTTQLTWNIDVGAILSPIISH